MQVRHGKGINRSCIDMMVMRIWLRYWYTYRGHSSGSNGWEEHGEDKGKGGWIVGYVIQRMDRLLVVVAWV